MIDGAVKTGGMANALMPGASGGSVQRRKASAHSLSVASSSASVRGRATCGLCGSAGF